MGAGRRKLEEAEQIAAPGGGLPPRRCLSGFGICTERKEGGGSRGISMRAHDSS